MQEIIIKKNDSGQRVDKFLKRYLPNAGTSFIFKMMRKKNIILNKQKVQGNEIIKENDCIQIFFSEDTIDKFRNSNQAETNALLIEYEKAYKKLNGIEIIYENDDVLLLGKPSGILTQKAKPHDLTLNEWLIGYLLNKNEVCGETLSQFKPSVCNRLDRNTSGIVICGKTLYGTQTMSECIKTRTIHKYYHLFVVGCLEGENTLTGYLLKDNDSNTVKIINAKQKSNDLKDFITIETKYKSISTAHEITYLEVELITGKTHQIRAHLSSIGHPILGDYKYGDAAINKKLLSLGINDQMLHAYRLVFPPLKDRLSDLSEREFICSEPDTFNIVKEKYFKE